MKTIKILTQTDLNELLDQKIAILNCETQEVEEDYTVGQICAGFDMYIEIRKNQFCLFDIQDLNYTYRLGNTIKSALNELNTFIECFNDMPYWEVDFRYYYE